MQAEPHQGRSPKLTPESPGALRPGWEVAGGLTGIAVSLKAAPRRPGPHRPVPVAGPVCPMWAWAPGSCLSSGACREGSPGVPSRRFPDSPDPTFQDTAPWSVPVEAHSPLPLGCSQLSSLHLEHPGSDGLSPPQHPEWLGA